MVVGNKYWLMCRSLGKCAVVLTVSLLLATCGTKQEEHKDKKPRKEGEYELVTYPEKAPMYLLTDRAPQLETPLKIFRQDITPNEYFFVRWHLSQLVTKIDADTFRLRIGGAVDTVLELSLNDLRTKFPVDSVVALAICSGNSRKTFTPAVPGGQWCNGAMGNAKWTGVKLKYILERAGIKKDAVEVTFDGMDRSPLPGVADFVKSLTVTHAMDGEVLVAYAMNGKDIPVLNGFPLKLVVPGWYATYWVSALGSINALTEHYEGFWMKKAYLVADNPTITEKPDSLAQKTVPITTIKMHSIFVEPDAEQRVVVNKTCLVEGLAFTDGTALKKVEVSLDDGATWTDARMDAEIGKYSWRRWRYDWTPTQKGVHHLCVRATDVNGNTQPMQQWNRSGYARSFVEHLDVNVH